MIGIDIVEINRVLQLLVDKPEDFLNRIFTENEREYIAYRRNAAQTVAGLYAGKEAILKAIGTGIGNGASFHQIEIYHDELGQPKVRVSGHCEERLKTKGELIELSISHSNSMAIAVAVIR